jgi:AmmeMemoRadiSam system protein A
MSGLTNEQRRTLLALARRSIEEYLKNGKRTPLPNADAELCEELGAFVTLHKRGQLRGCIGNMVGRGPLIETIREMAIAAATGDPRFKRMTAEELKECDIEISVLSPLKRIDDIEDIKVGTHGILMSRGPYHGVLLPQVATEYGWDRDTFLMHTCLKAGLPEDAWQDPATTIEIFSADVFGEKEPK